MKDEVRLNPGTWMAIYMPLFILFFIILPQQHAVRRAVLTKIKKRKGAVTMTNEVLRKYIGKNCNISTGTFGTNVNGKIVDVNENWIEVETRKGSVLINAEYIQSIKIK